jgi:hypothetical protein
MMSPPPLQAGFNVGGCELAEEPLFSRQLGYFLVPKSLLHEHTGTPFHVLWYARGIRSLGGNYLVLCNIRTTEYLVSFYGYGKTRTI